MNRVLLFFFALSLHCSSASGFIDRIFEISIPGYSGAYNPSIVECDGGYLLAFRYDTYVLPISAHLNDYKQYIGLVRLSEGFEPVGEAQLVLGDRAYDPRLIALQDRLYIIFAGPCPLECHSCLSSHLNLALICWSGSEFTVAFQIPLSVPFQKVWEKNWVPFVSEEELFLEYTINPQNVIKPSFETGICTPISKIKQKIHWPYGEIRGGTPAMKTRDGYLGFFHSSMRYVKRGPFTYYIGAYLFSSTPPFKLTKISKVPFFHSDFYSKKKNELTKSNVLFPGGFVEKKGKIYLLYGENDAAIKCMVIDKNKLLSTLKAVK